MSNPAKNRESFFSQASRYLARAVAAASVTKLIILFSGIGQGERLGAVIQIYRGIIYPFHYGYEWLLDLHLTDTQRDIITLYMMGCAAQFQYLKSDQDRVKVIYLPADRIPFTEFMSPIYKYIYVFLWPLIIFADLPIPRVRRSIWRYIVEKSRKKPSREMLEKILEADLVIVGFVKGLLYVIVIIALFLIANAIDVRMSS